MSMVYRSHLGFNNHFSKDMRTCSLLNNSKSIAEEYLTLSNYLSNSHTQPHTFCTHSHTHTSLTKKQNKTKTKNICLVVLKLQVVQSVWPMRTSLKRNIGSWDTLKIQVAHLDQGIQSITNHWSTKKRQAIKKEEKMKEKRHLLSLHNKQKNTKLLVGSHFSWLPIRNLCLAKGWVGRIRVITL